jgi:hypothetical protein
VTPIFIDRDLGKKFGRALAAVGVPTVLHIDRYAKADAESVPDRAWIAEAARRGEVIFTRDGKIGRRSAELDAVVRAGAKCFVLETGNATPLVYLRAAMIAWPKIEAIVATEPAPFMFGIDRTGRVTRRYPPKV